MTINKSWFPKISLRGVQSLRMRTGRINGIRRISRIPSNSRAMDCETGLVKKKEGKRVIIDRIEGESSLRYIVIKFDD